MRALPALRGRAVVPVHWNDLPPGTLVRYCGKPASARLSF
jgi:hypothetical protein